MGGGDCEMKVEVGRLECEKDLSAVGFLGSMNQSLLFQGETIPH